MNGIVIIDDNPDNLNLLAGILREHGYKVRLANDPRLALAAVHKAPPDLILLDIDMPGIDGYEVCRQLKFDPGSSEIPVIFLSAYDAPLDKVRAFQVGGVDYVTKPFQSVEVMAQIECIPQSTMEALVAYHWPGNVREVENLIERAMIISQGTDLEFGEWLPKPSSIPAQDSRILTLEEQERNHILRALSAAGWRVSGQKGAAEMLGIKSTTLEARMKKLGIGRDEGRS